MPSLNTKLASAPNTQTNYVLKATSSTTIGNSIIQDNGSTATVGGALTATGQVEGTIINSTSNAFRLNGNNALNLVTLNSQSVVKINAAGFWGTQIVGANDQGLLINNTGAATFSNRVTANDYVFTGTGAVFQGSPSAGTSAQYGYFQNTGGVFYFGRDNSAASEFGVGAYSTILWNSGNNPLVIATNNTERFRIAANGNVGIGTSSPQRTFDARGTVNLSTTAPTVGSTSGAYADVHLRTYNVYPTAQAKIVVVDFWTDFYSTYTDGFRWFNWDSAGTTPVERMRITSGGDVQVQGTNSNAKIILFRNYSNSQPGISVYNTSNTEVMYFNGNTGGLGITGALSKGSGSFKIDHPIESMKDTHYLVHSFVESPQANNIYRGKVQLIDGKALINLDEVSTMTEGTFVILNRDIHTYTSNETDWDAVRGRVDGNILTIECENNQSNAIVSWLVIGERQDKHMMDTEWTDDNGKVIVEPLKPATNQSTY